MKRVPFKVVPPQPPTTGDEWVRHRSGPVEESAPPAPAEPAEPLKRLTIDVSQSLHTRMKMGCAAEGVKMADRVRALLEAAFPAPPKS